MARTLVQTIVALLSMLALIRQAVERILMLDTDA
jgi:hypothetical protein